MLINCSLTCVNRSTSLTGVNRSTETGIKTRALGLNSWWVLFGLKTCFCTWVAAGKKFWYLGSPPFNRSTEILSPFFDCVFNFGSTFSYFPSGERAERNVNAKCVRTFRRKPLTKPRPIGYWVPGARVSISRKNGQGFLCFVLFLYCFSTVWPIFLKLIPCQILEKKPF